MKKPESLAAWDGLPENIREALVSNNLATLKPQERLTLYTTLCSAKGLDPATRPFEFISLNGKLTMYARKEAGDQLRERNGISAEIISAESQGDVYVVHIRAKNAEGRIEDDIGATGISEPEFITKKDLTKIPNPRHGKPMEGLDKANAMMKAVTKGKRRCTLAICGLGMYDESEIEAIADADKGKAPSLEEVQAIAAKVRALKEQAAKGPKNEAADLIRQACALEESILNLPGSGHTPEEPKNDGKQAAGGSPAGSTPPPVTKPLEQKQEAPKEPVKAPEPPITVTGQTNVQQEERPLTQPETENAPATEGGGSWREHTVRIIPHKAFKGKKVGEIQPVALLKTIHDNWVVKFAEEISKNPDKQADAAAITEACKELGLL